VRKETCAVGCTTSTDCGTVVSTTTRGQA
jgi:hypothetical protein